MNFELCNYNIMTRKKIGLALSGGAARGFAHLGVLKVLAEHEIPIDFIAGTSRRFVCGRGVRLRLERRRNHRFRRKKISWFVWLDFPIRRKEFCRTRRWASLSSRIFPFANFEDLPIPFAAVACDLETGDEVVLKDTAICRSPIRASCAIPGVFVPLEDADGRKLIDGGVVSPVPTKAVRKLGAEIVIAVDVMACGATYWGTPSTLLGVFFQSAMMLLRTASKAQHYRADVVIIPQIAHLATGRNRQNGRIYQSRRRSRARKD